MARQVIDISTANSGQGTPLRTAFSMINSMTEDLYADDAGDVNSITATAPIARNSATGAVTISLNDGGISTQKIADDAVTADKLANSINSEITANTAKTGITSGQASAITANTAKTGITSGQASAITANTAKTGITSGQASAITANTAKVTNATHTGDVTGATALTIAADAVTYAKMQNLGTANRLLGSTSTGVIGETQVVAAMMAANSVDSDSYVDGSIDTVHVANDQITHDKLENRFTAVSSVSNRSGATTIDWSAAAVFVMANSLNGNIEFDFTNFKAGQTIDIYNLTGAYTITFDSNAGTSETFNKCGAVDYVAASTNLIQIQCVDDDATAVFNYAVSAYVSGATPS